MTKITKNLVTKLFFILCFLFTIKGTAATIYFNQVYKATGNSYTINSKSITELQILSGSSSRFF